MTEENTPNLDQLGIALGDSPISTRGADRLGRGPFAEALAEEVLAAPADHGYVMALCGPWGIGKTSVLNLTMDAIGERADVVQFNPWMFSGSDALVISFFDEIGKQLWKRGKKLRKLAGKMANYGHALSPLAAVVGAGSALDAAAGALDALAVGPSVLEQRDELRELLIKRDHRLVVVIDDLDRLRPTEVLDMVRLVRLVGDFPNTVYLLAFDRQRVEECLAEHDPQRGRAYLEKIVQVIHDVPMVREPSVKEVFVDGLQQLVGGLPSGPFDSEDWQNVFHFVVLPLLKTPRDVRRLLGSLSMTMRLIGDEVAFADLVGIEALRVLRPEMFAAMVSVADQLGIDSLFGAHIGYQHAKPTTDSPIKPMMDVDTELATAACRWLFPAALRHIENRNYGSEWEGTWRFKRKLASKPVLRFYLERQLPNGIVPARVVSEAIENLGDRQALGRLFDGLSASELLDLIERMNGVLEEVLSEDVEKQSERAQSALPVLFNLLPRLPEDNGSWSFTGSMVLMRAAIRLLKGLPTEEARADIVRVVLPEIESLAARLNFLQVLGHREDIGVKLIAEDVATQLEEEVRQELITRSAESFAKETRCLRLAGLLVETSEGKQALLKFFENDQVVLSLLTGAAGQVRGQVMGAAAVRLTEVLDWDHLVSLLGAELLERRIAELLKAIEDGELEIPEAEVGVLLLAADYATGNRPMRPIDRFIRMQADQDESQVTDEDGGDSETVDGVSDEGSQETR